MSQSIIGFQTLIGYQLSTVITFSEVFIFALTSYIFRTVLVS